MVWNYAAFALGIVLSILCGWRVHRQVLSHHPDPNVELLLVSAGSAVLSFLVPFMVAINIAAAFSLYLPEGNSA